jgi:hypothetical protein
MPLFPYILSLFLVSATFAAPHAGTSNFDGVSSGVQLEGAVWSSDRPVSGSLHLKAQPSTFEYATFIQAPEIRTGSLLVTCFVDPRGSELALHFALNGQTITENIDPSLVGYRQVVVNLPFQEQGLLSVSSSGNGTVFLLDELYSSELHVVLPVRPEATQVLSNYKITALDGFSGLTVNDSDLFGSRAHSCDGYTLIDPRDLTIDSDGSTAVTVTAPQTGKDHLLLVWNDANGDGAFTQEEQLVREKIQGAYTFRFQPEGVQQQGGGILRMRLLDPANSAEISALSGNTWGETIDILFRTDQPVSEVCRCAQPDYYMDLSGRKLLTLEGVPSGMYFKVSAQCTEKTLIIR